MVEDTGLTTAQIRALMAVALCPQPITVRKVAKILGRGVGSTHSALCRLRKGGWIDWEQGRQATIHTTLEWVNPWGISDSR